MHTFGIFYRAVYSRRKYRTPIVHHRFAATNTEEKQEKATQVEADIPDGGIPEGDIPEREISGHAVRAERSFLIGL